MQFKDDHKNSWKISSKTIDKSWGYEILIGTIDGIHSKVLFMRSGQSNSLKYYKTKTEILFLRKGKIKVVHGCEYTLQHESQFPYEVTILEPGEGMTIQAECPYQVFAIEDSEIYELGDKSSDQRITITRNQ